MIGSWPRADVFDLGILVLLIVWFTLDRCNIYFRKGP